MADERPTVLEPRFVEILNKVISSLPRDDTITSSIRQRLEAIWNTPRVEDIASCLGAEAITKQQAQEMVFFPTSQHAEQYCQLIKPPPVGCSKDHPQVKVQIEFLTILYLHHIPHGDWTEFIQPFVLAGGFEHLAMSFNHPNLYLRGQAVDAFLQITASPSFDWWNPLSLSARKRSKDTKTLLHLRMLELSKSDHFLPGLMENADGSKSWPGGPTQCLQLLASWLSWCRTLYTPSQSIRLSRSMLAAIRQWGDHNGSTTLKDYEDVDVGTGPPPELVEFRLKMLADFSRESPIDGPEFIGDIRCAMVEGILFPTDVETTSEVIIEVDDSGSFDISEPKPPTPPLNVPSKSSFKLPVSRDFSCVSSKVSSRELGNKAFAEGRLEDALSAYDDALSQLKCHTGREYAILQCNRATVYLNLSKQKDQSSELQREFLQKAEDAAKCSVDGDPTYPKANYRLAQCLAESGRLKAALSALKSSALFSKDRKQPKKNGRVPKSEQIEMAATDKLLVQLMEKLALEVEAREIKEVGSTDNQDEKYLEREASIMVKILRRKDAKTRHDYLAQRSSAPESAPDVLAATVAIEGEPDEVKDEPSMDIVVKRPLTDKEVSMMAEERSEELARHMLELSKDEDSDDDDVVARIKKARESKGKQKKKTKESGFAKCDVSSSESSSTVNMAYDEEEKGQKVLRKIVHSPSDRSSRESKKSSDKKMKKTGAEKEKTKGKQEKKSQMDELRRIAKSAPVAGAFA